MFDLTEVDLSPQHELGRPWQSLLILPAPACLPATGSTRLKVGQGLPVAGNGVVDLADYSDKGL